MSLASKSSLAREISAACLLLFALCGASRAFAAAEDAFENNDAAVDARSLPEGVQTLTAGDEDWFFTSLPANRALNVSINFQNAQNDLDLELLNGSLARVGLANSNGDTETLSAPASATDNRLFFIRVFAAGYAATEYTLTITFGPPEDAYEPNDTAATAAVITPGTYDPLFCRNDDYYRVNSGANSSIGVKALFTHAAGDLDLELLDQNFNPLLSSEFTKDNETVNYPGAPGVVSYIIHVYGFSGAMNQYSLVVGPTNDDPYEFNNSTDLATHVSFGTFTGLQSLDDDWWRVDTASEQGLTATINFTHANGDLDMQVLGSESLVDMGSSVGTGNSETVTTPGQPGYTSYYIHVYGSGGGMNSYSMTLTPEAGFTNHRLFLSSSPSGGGTILASPVLANSNGAYAAGTQVTLTAKPAAGYGLASWSGASEQPAGSHASPISFPMDKQRTIAANFANRFPVNVASIPYNAGTVTRTPSPGADGLYPYGTTVILKGVPAGNCTFDQWVDGRLPSSIATHAIDSSITTAHFSVPEDAFEPNNTVGIPRELANGRYPLLKCLDSDVYKVKTRKGGRLTATIKVTDGDGNLGFAIFDSHQVNLDQYIGSSGKTLSVQGGADNEFFYVLVTRNTGTFNIYDLDVAGEQNAADNWALYQ